MNTTRTDPFFNTQVPIGGIFEVDIPYTTYPTRQGTIYIKKVGSVKPLEFYFNGNYPNDIVTLDLGSSLQDIASSTGDYHQSLHATIARDVAQFPIDLHVFYQDNKLLTKVNVSNLFSPYNATKCFRERFLVFRVKKQMLDSGYKFIIQGEFVNPQGWAVATFEPELL